MSRDRPRVRFGRTFAEVSDKECPKSSVWLVSDNAKVRSITRGDIAVLDGLGGAKTTREPKPREEAAYIWDEGASKSETLVWEVKQKRNHNRTLLLRIIKMTNEKFEGVFDYKEGDTIPVAKCQPIKLQLKPG